MTSLISALLRGTTLELRPDDPPRPWVAGAPLTTDGTVLGTPHYTAPEQLRAAGWTVEQLREADERAGDMGWDAESVDDGWLEADTQSRGVRCYGSDQQPAIEPRQKNATTSATSKSCQQQRPQSQDGTS